jgi:hypothetical protein
MDVTAETLAGRLARMLAEGHGLAARPDGTVVHLDAGGLRVKVGDPDTQPHGLSVRVPIGVNHPSWGEVFAWDQSVGLAAGDRHPTAEALDGWVHNVLPVFAAMALPGSGLAGRAAPFAFSDGRRTMDVHYGPLAVRDFGGLGEDLRRAAAERPPTMVLVDELFTGYALPDRPLWLYTFCARTPNGPITEVTLLNGDSSASFGHIADHLPWEGHGSLKSWALAVPRRDPAHR